MCNVQLTMLLDKFNVEKSFHFFSFHSLDEWIHIYVTVHVDVKYSIFLDHLVQQLFVQFDGRYAFCIVIIMRSTKKEQNATEIDIEKFKFYCVLIRYPKVKHCHFQ